LSAQTSPLTKSMTAVALLPIIPWEEGGKLRPAKRLQAGSSSTA